MPGVPVQDIFIDINPLTAQPKERLGYPTQKPEALLERIIRASSNEGDLVLDPFCGCGTAVVVAERLHRRWLGIDITHLAINLIKNRLQNTFGPEQLALYEVIGEPADAKSAEALALENRHQFEWWALSLVNAHPAQDKKKGADRGIDGVIVFGEGQGQYQKMLVSVKSGHVNRAHIHELKGVMEREMAALGAFITLKPPTRPMREEAAAAGFYVPENFPEQRFPKLQILTVADLFAGKKLDYPRWWSEETFKKAARQRKGPNDAERQRDLVEEDRD